MSALALRTHAQPLCVLCDSEGRLLHTGLRDTLFGSPGEWQLRECINPDCGLVWLDPMPNSEEIGKLYQDYYTHASSNPGSSDPFLTKTLSALSKPLYSVWLRISGLRAARKNLNYLYLLNQRPGRLLDIGCGDGSRLARFRKRGWQVEGHETDTKAAAHAAEKYAIRVHTGNLLALGLAGNGYDAVTLNHVVEHLAEPAAILKECLRLARPGGVVVATTPNARSYGHEVFKHLWRGLEPPRHLYIYSEQALRMLSQKYDLGDAEIWSTPARAESIGLGSHMLLVHSNPRGTKLISPALRAKWFQAKAQVRHLLNRNSGEECVIRITKPGQ